MIATIIRTREGDIHIRYTRDELGPDTKGDVKIIDTLRDADWQKVKKRAEQFRQDLLDKKILIP